MAFNGTSAHSHASSGLFGYAYDVLATSSTTRLVLGGLVVFPVLVIALNVLAQLLIPRNPSEPPVVFHWIPWFGSAAGYGDEPVKFFFNCREKYGNVFTFILFGRRVTVALGPKGNNFILGGKSTALSAEDAYTHLTTPVFGKDVVYDVPNELFMEQKKFVKVGLSTDNFRAYVGMFEDEVENFLNHDPIFAPYQQHSDEWNKFDVVKVMQEITILTASRTLQGKEVREAMDKSFAELYNDLDGGFTPINFLFPNLPLPSYRRRDRAQQKMSEFYVNIIKKRRQGAEDAEPDMIAALMEQKYRDGRPLADHEIAHIMIALLMAGQHTSSTSGSWALLHLAANPQVTKALYDEQVKHFAGPDGKLRPMTYEEVRELPILDSVIRETLRLHPPIHSIMRYVRDDVVVPPTLAAPGKDDSSYIVPKGYYVLAAPAVSQVDPLLWKDAETWEPTRWSDPEGVAQQANKAYVDENGEKIDYGFGLVSKGTESPYQPFGAGKHRCIGEQFAYLQLGTVIVTIIRNLELRLDQPVPGHNYHTMITMPLKPRDISYRRRK